jgi:hypothetical protein
MLPIRGGGMDKAVSNRQAKDALVRQHGKEGAWYLEHLLTSSSNPYLKRAVEDIKREAEVAELAPRLSRRAQ